MGVALVEKELERELTNLTTCLANALSAKRKEELKERTELIKKLKSALLLKKVTEKELIEKSKKQFEQKLPWKKEYTKDHPELKEDKEQINKGFKKYALKKMAKIRMNKSPSYIREEFEILEAVEAWVTMKFKEKIELWALTADDHETIVNKIYKADEIPRFFRCMQDDFQKTYLKLKQCVKDLSAIDIPALPKDSEVKEYKISFR